MWIAKLLRRSLDRDLDSGMVRLKRKTLGAEDFREGKAPNLGDAEVRILRAGRIAALHTTGSLSDDVMD